jgi:hypothetical protein
MTKSTIQTKHKGWTKTRRLLESLTPEQLSAAADQAQRHEPITNEAVKELLKMVARVGASSPGSGERKWYMYTQLKSRQSIMAHPLYFSLLILEREIHQ